MNLLKISAEKFNEYAGYNYTFIMDCNLSVNVEFQASQFHHLIGLHYLKDIVQVDKSQSGNSTINIFKGILKGKITQDLIQKSNFYDKISGRLLHFPDLDEIVHAKLIVDFDYTKLKQSKIMSRYLLYKQYGDTYVILALRYNSNKDVYVPETFIVEHSDYYVKDQMVYEVVDVKCERILKNRKSNEQD